MTRPVDIRRNEENAAATSSVDDIRRNARRRSKCMRPKIILREQATRYSAVAATYANGIDFASPRERSAVTLPRTGRFR
jgi:hypothetical protein